MGRRIDLRMTEQDIKEKILAAIANSRDTATASRMGSLANKDEINPDLRDNLESQYTALAEYLLNVSMEPLYKAYVENNLQIKDVVWLLHAIATAGWVPDEGADEEKEERSLNFRTHEVQVGTLIPPHHDDVEELMGKFVDKISQFISEPNNLVEDMMICAWSYTIFVVIHPYSDGNGRTSRGIVKFLDYASQRKRGIPEELCKKRTFPNRRDDADVRDKAIQAMKKVIEFDSLVPVDELGGEKSSQARYHKLAANGRSRTYFDEAKTLLETYFAKVSSSTDLYKNQHLAELAGYMMQTDYIKPGETKRLIAEEGVQKFKQKLSE